MTIKYPADPIVEALLNKIKERSDKGMAHYGQPLTRTDLQPHFWREAAVEEVIDFLLYFLRLQRTRAEAEAFVEETVYEIVDVRYGSPNRIRVVDVQDVYQLLDFIYGAKDDPPAT